MLLFEAGTEGCIQEEVEIEKWEHPDQLWNMEIPSGFVAIGEEKIREDFPYDDPPDIVRRKRHGLLCKYLIKN